MRLLIGCLLLSSSSMAQLVFPSRDSSIVQQITNLPANEPFDTSRSWHRVVSPYMYIVSDKDIYDHFSYEKTMEFQDFNFSKYHILGEKVGKKWVWFIRANEKALAEIPLVTMPGHETAGPSAQHNLFFRDTIMKTPANANWYTTGHGDCMASFTYRLYKDKYHPVIVLKEWNHWGGCRAGGSKIYTLTFSMPAGILYTFKNTILRDKLEPPQ